MYTLLFLFLAAASNACMDTLKDHYAISIFYGLNPNFWNPSISWMNIVFGYVSLDAWHLFKGAMLGCLYCAIYFHSSVFGLWDILLYPIIWGIGFQLFYSIILKRR